MCRLGFEICSIIKNGTEFPCRFSLSKNPGVDKGPQPLMALFGFGDMRGKSAKALAQQGFPCIRCWPRHRCKHRMKKLKKVASSHFFDTLKRHGVSVPFALVRFDF